MGLPCHCRRIRRLSTPQRPLQYQHHHRRREWVLWDLDGDIASDATPTSTKGSPSNDIGGRVRQQLPPEDTEPRELRHGRIQQQLQQMKWPVKEAKKQGEAISKGHKNYELMLLQLDIRGDDAHTTVEDYDGPEKKMLKRLMVEDAAEANIVFSSLMGTQVDVRKELIQNSARLFKPEHLDI